METSHRLRDIIEKLADQFKLSESEITQLLPSKTRAIFDIRVGWSKTPFLKAGLLESTRRYYFMIIDRGRDVLKANPPQINMSTRRCW